MSYKDKKIKVLALLDSPTVSTGFATVSKNVLKKLNDTGKYDITVVGINYHGTLTREQQSKYPYSFTPAMPAGYSDAYGRGRVVQILSGNDREIRPGFDLLFTIQDHFILQGADQVAEGYNFSKRIKELQSEIIENPNYDINYLFSWIGYYPVDGKLQQKWVNKGIGYCDYPVAYTQFGKDQILTHDNDTIKLKDRTKIIPHGVNIKDFYPLSQEEIDEFRTNYFPKEIEKDAFIIMNVNRNQIRKDIASTIKAFAKYKKINPKAVLYIHAKQIDQGGDLWEIAQQFGLEIGKDMLLPSNFNEMFGIPVDILNKIYNCADVLVSTTLGEGWGFINTEAMAVKKPLLTPANTAMPEIIGMNNIYEKEVGLSYVRTHLKSLRGIPVLSGYGENDFVSMGSLDNSVIRPKVDIDDLVAKLDWVYNNPKDAQTIAKNGYKWVQELEWENVSKQWEELFDKAYSDLEAERKLGHTTRPTAVMQKDGKTIPVNSKGEKIKIRPNDPCFCKSSKKYKVCCGKN